jgi:hypothetical protein
MKRQSKSGEGSTESETEKRALHEGDMKIE